MTSKIPIGIPSARGSCTPPSQREADDMGESKVGLSVKENVLGVVPKFLLLSHFEDVVQ